jgi:hypothetical protein
MKFRIFFLSVGLPRVLGKCESVYVPGVLDFDACDKICENSRECQCFSFEKDTKNCFLKSVIEFANFRGRIFFK